MGMGIPVSRSSHGNPVGMGMDNVQFGKGSGNGNCYAGMGGNGNGQMWQDSRTAQYRHRGAVVTSKK